MLGPGNEESIHEQNDNATNSAGETIEAREDPPAYEDPPSFHDVQLNQLCRSLPGDPELDTKGVFEIDNEKSWISLEILL